jgi:hypothetical protein
MKYFITIPLIACIPTVLCGQPLLPREAAAIEKAYAAPQRLTNAVVQIRRGFNQNAAFENTPADVAGIARTSTKTWERIEIHLPRVLSSDHMACLMVNSKCRNLPVGASLDKKNSILYWHVPNPYKGDFDFVFLQPGGQPMAVRVTAGSDIVTNLKVGTQ